MGQEAEDLRDHAKRCRRLARAVDSPATIAKLTKLAEDFDTAAEKVDEAARDGALPPIPEE